ncbi:hypothetical protein KUTeg_010017, partial [Tegillarca granosa]
MVRTILEIVRISGDMSIANNVTVEYPENICSLNVTHMNTVLRARKMEVRIATHFIVTSFNIMSLSCCLIMIIASIYVIVKLRRNKKDLARTTRGNKEKRRSAFMRASAHKRISEDKRFIRIFIFTWAECLDVIEISIGPDTIGFLLQSA